MAEFFVEIGCEEIPAKMVEESLFHGKTLLEKYLSEFEISFSEISPYASPTRLIYHIEKIDEKEEDKTVRVQGPPKKICFQDNGEPSKALQGFMKKNNATLDDVEFEEGKTGEIAVCSSFVKGRLTADILSEGLTVLMKKIQFRKNMKWADKQETFVRPVRWICALLDGKVVPFEFAGVQSSDKTWGHRILGKRDIPVTSFEHFKKTLEDNAIIIEQDRRKKMVADAITHFETTREAKAVMDDGLLHEMAYLTEYPFVVHGEFDRKFLEIPEEVLITSMKEHQKYFAARNKQGDMIPEFLAIASTTADPKGYIKVGNERVLAARLYDAQFFWNEDRKKTLVSRLSKMEKMTFQNDLGSYMDKIDRMKKIVDILSEYVELHSVNTLETVNLSKCDLATDMVYEFPELQGVMGGLYAKHEGMDEDVWKGIYDHYKPASMEDSLPETPAGLFTSLTDKLDTFLGCLAVGIVPTGSKDPFGLRRAAQGIVRIIFERKLSFDFFGFVRQCADIYTPFLKMDQDTWMKHVMDIFNARISFWLEKQGYSYDEIEAVMVIDNSDMTDTLSRIHALKHTRHDSEFMKVATSFKRINNILNSTDVHPGEVNEQLLKDDSEKQLFDALNNLREELGILVDNKDYEHALTLVSSMASTVDRFFDDVLVMDKDEAVKVNRLSLLNALKQEFLKIADFSSLVINK